MKTATECDNGYEELATAIVEQAVKDWRSIEIYDKPISYYNELRRFFKGDWCAMLCLKLKPKLILHELERMTKPRTAPKPKKAKQWAPRWIEYKGRYLRAKDWEGITGIPSTTILARIDVYGWEVEKALTVLPYQGKQTKAKEA